MGVRTNTEIEWDTLITLDKRKTRGRIKRFYGNKLNNTHPYISGSEKPIAGLTTASCLPDKHRVRICSLRPNTASTTPPPEAGPNEEGVERTVERRGEPVGVRS